MAARRINKRPRRGPASPREQQQHAEAATDDVITDGQRTTDALHEALAAGALRFLELEDMVAALNCCRALRFDAELALVGLGATEEGRHLFRGCSGDLALLRRSFFVDPRLLDDTCTTHSDSTMPTTTTPTASDVALALKALEAATARRGRATALLSALAMVRRRIAPLCFHDDVINTYGDRCTARPVLVPLFLDAPSTTGDVIVVDPTDREAVARDLDALVPGLGSHFTATPGEYNHVSDFGAHWETYRVPTPASRAPTTTATTTTALRTRARRRGLGNQPQTRTSTVSCGLCETARVAIRDYRKAARAALRAFQDVVRERREEWIAEGLDADEIHQRRSELKAEFFPDESYPDVNFAEGQDDEILADICESGRFPVDPFAGCHAGFDRLNDDLFHALREEYLGLCATRFRSLREALVDHCAWLGRRVQEPWMTDAAPGEAANAVSLRGELVAGVTAAGFLCGVYLVTQRVE